MNYSYELKIILNNIGINDSIIQHLSTENISLLITFLSPKTYTGRNSHSLKNYIKKFGLLPLFNKEVTNAAMFPEVYMNYRLETDDIIEIENIRNCEYMKIYNSIKNKDKEIIYPKYTNINDIIVFDWFLDDCQQRMSVWYWYKEFLKIYSENLPKDIPNQIILTARKDYRKELAMYEFYKLNL